MILDDIEKKVDKVEDHLDNINIKMKKSLDGVTKLAVSQLCLN
jgi:hypothetical protein